MCVLRERLGKGPLVHDLNKWCDAQSTVSSKYDDLSANYDELSAEYDILDSKHREHLKTMLAWKFDGAIPLVCGALTVRHRVLETSL